MKRALFIAALAVFSTAVAGEPLTNVDSSKLVNDSEKAPRIIPGKPSAQVDNPKYSIVVPCTKSEDGKVGCVDIGWPPVLGPAEYVLTPMAKPTTVTVEKEKIVTVVKEVPAKKIKE